MRCWVANGRVIADETRPRVMGILNVTPDSFSDGGRWFDPAIALSRAEGLRAEGADILDVGAESSRPGAEPIDAEEERARLAPVLEALVASGGGAVSVDTMKAEVARWAIGVGVEVINDIGGLRDPGMVRLAAESAVGLVVMHMAGEPRTMQVDPRYRDVVVEVYDDLARRVDEAERAGVERRRIAIDPGIGFGKTFEHNMMILRGLRRFANLGCVVLIGTSRKGFLGTITGRAVGERATASVVSSLAAAVEGAGVLRVHDVGPMVDAIRVWQAIQGWDRCS